MSEAFTIHPPIPPCPNPSDLGYAYEDWFDDRGIERRLTAKKRFSDAELAAEYWQGALIGSVHPVDAFHTFSGVEIRGKSADRLSALERFATLPHYDEPQP